jgi:hypothetical protein
MSSPFCIRLQSRNDKPSNELRSWGCYSEQNDSTRGGQLGSKSQFSKILIKCKQDPLFGNSAGQDFLIPAAWSICSDPSHIVTYPAQGFDSIERKIFIREKPHFILTE